AYDDKAGVLFVGCGGRAPMIIAVDAKTCKELTSVVIPAGIDNLHYDSKRNRLYASCGDGTVAVVEKKGDRYELIAKVETPKRAKTSACPSGSGPAVRRRASRGRHRNPSGLGIRGRRTSDG